MGNKGMGHIASVVSAEQEAVALQDCVILSSGLAVLCVRVAYTREISTWMPLNT